MEKVAQQAGKAAPAVALAGAALVAAPAASHALADSGSPTGMTVQGHSFHANPAQANPLQDITGQVLGTVTKGQTPATLDAFETKAVTVAGAKPARHAAQAQSTTYRVRSGDTLSQIANQFFHNDNWQYLYHANAKTVSDPDLIFTGQSLVIPASVPAHSALSDYVPRHAKPAAPAQAATHSSHHSGSAVGGTADGGSVVTQSAAQGQYSCSSLEGLWQQAGGSASTAFMAAEIAMAESGGNSSAISPTNDFGLWQINGSNGALATLNPFQNAKSAVTMSDNGTNWGPWTTFHSGAYSGKC